MKEKKEVEEKPEAKLNPVKEVSDVLVAAFDHLNTSLFGGELTRPMVLFTRNTRVIRGRFAEDKWFNEDGVACHEITINANHMASGDEVHLYQVLVHEMVHQWQHEKATPSKTSYHNREWADKALEVGLKPSAADHPECETGEKISTTLIPGGKAMLAIANMPEEIQIPWYAVPMDDAAPDAPQPDKPKEEDGGPPDPKKKNKTKYTCHKCGFNLWGKPGGKIQCVPCSTMFTETV